MKEKRKGGYAARETEMALFGSPSSTPGRTRRAVGRARPKRSFRALSWIGGTAFSVLLAGVLAKGITGSSFFALERIAVEGSLQTSLGEIPGLMALKGGGNLLTLDISEVARGLGSRPEIRRASVAKRFPNELVVKVEERKPSVLVLVEGKLYQADEEGVLLREIGPGDPMDLPVISGLSRSAVAVGVKPDGRQVPSAIRLLRVVERKASTFGLVSEVRVDPVEGLTLFLEELPVPVRVGWENFEQKISRLERVFSRLTEREGELVSVDLRFDHQVVVRQRPAGAKVAVRKGGTAALAQLSPVLSDR